MACSMQRMEHEGMRNKFNGTELYISLILQLNFLFFLLLNARFTFRLSSYNILMFVNIYELCYISFHFALVDDIQVF